MSGKKHLDGVVEHEERLEDGAVLLFSRNGIFQARIYKGEGKRSYIYKSLKTRNVVEARKRAVKYFYETEFRKEQDLPLQQVTFTKVIDEYVALRQNQYDRSLKDKINSSRQQQTSVHMLRQIKRVVKFWHDYCGKRSVDKIDNAVLQDYVPWRKDFYHRMPAEDRPKNARINPADKTIEWEVILAKTMLKFADERGYRGKIALPTWRFKSDTRIVRPAFTTDEMARIYRFLPIWIGHVDVYTEPERGYVHILAKSGMRVGEANNLLESDIIEIVDDNGRKNYQFNVKGKTGSRVVIPRVSAVRFVERVLERNKLVAIDKDKVRKRRKVDSIDKWVFRRIDGNQVITFIDLFQSMLREMNLEKNRFGDRYTLYSLRHFYAVRMLHKSVPVWDIARNMGTSVQIIEQYYGKSATSQAMATKLGG